MTLKLADYAINGRRMTLTEEASHLGAMRKGAHSRDAGQIGELTGIATFLSLMDQSFHGVLRI